MFSKRIVEPGIVEPGILDLGSSAPAANITIEAAKAARLKPLFKELP